MTETAALLADDVLPRQPIRQSVLSLRFALRYLLATAARGRHAARRRLSSGQLMARAVYALAAAAWLGLLVRRPHRAAAE